MGDFELAVLPERRGCPSDLALDQLQVGETNAEQTEELQAHICRCSHCGERWALRQRGADAFDGLSLERLISHVEQERRPANRLGRWLSFRWLVMGPALAAVAMGLFFSKSWMQPDVIATKGGIHLRVHQRTASGSRPVVHGAVLRAGDQIRFAITWGKEGRKDGVMILSVEERDKVAILYPPSGDRSGPPIMEADGFLKGAVELDTYSGREWLHLVACPSSFSRADVIVRGGRVLSLPPGCRSDTLAIRKASDT